MLEPALTAIIMSGVDSVCCAWAFVMAVIMRLHIRSLALCAYCLRRCFCPAYCCFIHRRFRRCCEAMDIHKRCWHYNQPSEIMKAGLVMMLAYIDRRVGYKRAPASAGLLRVIVPALSS